MRQKRRGPPAPFGPKDARNSSYTLTRLAKTALGLAARRAATSESNVVELVVRRHVAEVKAEDFVQDASA